METEYLNDTEWGYTRLHFYNATHFQMEFIANRLDGQMLEEFWIIRPPPSSLPQSFSPSSFSFSDGADYPSFSSLVTPPPYLLYFLFSLVITMVADPPHFGQVVVLFFQV